MGLQASMTPLNTWGINTLDNRVIQHANALANTLNQAAASFGTALLISVSAMGSVVAPQAARREQLYAGYHLSFAVVMVLAVCLLLVVVLAFVRDKRSAPAKAAPQAVAAQDDDAILVKAAMNRDASWISQTSFRPRGAA